MAGFSRFILCDSEKSYPLLFFRGKNKNFGFHYIQHASAPGPSDSSTSSIREPGATSSASGAQTPARAAAEPPASSRQSNHTSREAHTLSTPHRRAAALATRRPSTPPSRPNNSAAPTRMASLPALPNSSPPTAMLGMLIPTTEAEIRGKQPKKSKKHKRLRDRSGSRESSRSRKSKKKKHRSRSPRGERSSSPASLDSWVVPAGLPGVDPFSSAGPPQNVRAQLDG